MNIFSQIKDSVKSYDLNEITVKSESLIEPKPTTKIGQEILSSYGGNSLFEVAKYIPSVKSQTNSRGESLFYLRGTNERQLGLFFDGSLLNIPWDNRVDLSLLPINSFESLQIIKGVPSSIYGANNIAGVIVGKSKQINNRELNGNISSQFSNYGNRNVAISMNQKIGKFTVLISGNYFNRDSFVLPNDFNSVQNISNTRINSDQSTIGIYSKLGYEYKNMSNINVAFQYLNSEKGVPPEIGVSSPRYWRYPEWNKTGVNLLGSHFFDFESTSFLNYYLSAYNFKMKINQYEDNSYSSFDDIENNNDNVFYGRLIYTLLLNQNSILRFSTSGYFTEHTESFLSNNFNDVEYQQIVYSAGAEYELLENDFVFIGGLSFDGINAPKTGNFDTKNNLNSIGANATLKYYFSNMLNMQFNIGHKSRFPSLRESYSDGLGRFVANPNLTPEVVDDFEFGMEYLIPSGRLFANLLLTNLSDGIVRTSVETVNGKKFMRINKDEIRTYGLEIEGNNRFNKYLSVGFSFSYLNSLSKNSENNFADTLEYRPEIISNLFIKSEIANNLIATFESSFVANEFALSEGNSYYTKLPNYFVFNSRMGYKYPISEKQSLEFFARINNLFDKLYYTQLGLPEAGREYFVGIDFQF